MFNNIEQFNMCVIRVTDVRENCVEYIFKEVTSKIFCNYWKELNSISKNLHAFLHIDYGATNSLRGIVIKQMYKRGMTKIINKNAQLMGINEEYLCELKLSPG